MANPPTGFDHGVTLEATQTILLETLAEGRRLGLAPLTVVVLDQAAQRIVRLAAPFAPFTGDLAEYDRLEIIRTWRFARGDRLSSN